MYSYDQNVLINADSYEQEDVGFYNPVDTTNYTQVRATNYYKNMIINRCNFKKGVKSRLDKKTNQQVSNNYEMLTIELIDNVNRQKLSIAVNLLTQKIRTNELMFITGVSNFEPKELQRQDGTSFFVVNEFLGKMTDVVVDNFQYNSAGYLSCNVLGFFKDGYSPKEVMTKTKEREDYKKCLAHCKCKIGEQLQDTCYKAPTPPNTYNNAPMPVGAPQNQYRPMPSSIPPQAYHQSVQQPTADIPF